MLHVLPCESGWEAAKAGRGLKGPAQQAAHGRIVFIFFQEAPVGGVLVRISCWCTGQLQASTKGVLHVMGHPGPVFDDSSGTATVLFGYYLVQAPQPEECARG